MGGGKNASWKRPSLTANCEQALKASFLGNEPALSLLNKRDVQFLPRGYVIILSLSLNTI
jgi:hypothetical protein